jgi:exopolyphosphatase/guanosine-5'-triphosphate,3'-diphosphate pyrophosphatase
MAFVVETAHAYDPDPSHSEQVTALALDIFDGLYALHGYKSGERRLLEIAGRLHDIGWSRVVSGKHHKLSSEMIRELDIPGLDNEENLMCALIARYHTKALPDPSRHGRFASLDPDKRKVVEWLAGILRVADGLDCNHTSPIKRLSCTVGDKTVTIHLECSDGCRPEVEGARQKQELLLNKADRKIVYRC